MARRGGIVGKVFIDTSKSARNPKVVRPIVWDISRFTVRCWRRSALSPARRRGMPVWSLWGEFDMTNADGLKAFRDAVNQAAHESNKISEGRSAASSARLRAAGPTHAGDRSRCRAGHRDPEGWEAGDPRGNADGCARARPSGSDENLHGGSRRWCRPHPGRDPGYSSKPEPGRRLRGL
jgi:hypothetical protein